MAARKNSAETTAAVSSTATTPRLVSDEREALFTCFIDAPRALAFEALTDLQHVVHGRRPTSQTLEKTHD